MKIATTKIVALLLAAAVAMGMAGCGAGDGAGAEGAANSGQPGTVSVKTGTIATDSWGYTGSAPTQVAAPAGTELLLQGHTLLADASHAVVSGTSSTRLSFSSDPTSLAAAAQASAPGNFLCYLNISLGAAQTSYPEVSVSIDTAAAAGETVNICSYDAATRKWIQAKTAVVGEAGKVSFTTDRLTLWGIFR